MYMDEFPMSYCCIVFRDQVLTSTSRTSSPRVRKRVPTPVPRPCRGIPGRGARGSIRKSNGL